MDDICLSCLCSLDLPTAFNHALFHAEIPTYSQPKLPISNENDYTVKSSSASSSLPLLWEIQLSQLRAASKIYLQRRGEKGSEAGGGDTNSRLLTSAALPRHGLQGIWSLARSSARSRPAAGPSWLQEQKLLQKNPLPKIPSPKIPSAGVTRIGQTLPVKQSRHARASWRHLGDAHSAGWGQCCLLQLCSVWRGSAVRRQKKKQILPALCINRITPLPSQKAAACRKYPQQLQRGSVRSEPELLQQPPAGCRLCSPAPAHSPPNRPHPAPRHPAPCAGLLLCAGCFKHLPASRCCSPAPNAIRNSSSF